MYRELVEVYATEKRCNVCDIILSVRTWDTKPLAIRVGKKSNVANFECLSCAARNYLKIGRLRQITDEEIKRFLKFMNLGEVPKRVRIFEYERSYLHCCYHCEINFKVGEVIVSKVGRSTKRYHRQCAINIHLIEERVSICLE